MKTKIKHNPECNELFSMMSKGESRVCICNDPNRVRFEIHWRRPGHSWTKDIDTDTSTFETKKKALDFLKAGGFDTLETRIVEIKP